MKIYITNMEFNPIPNKTAQDKLDGQLSESVYGQTQSDVADNVHKYKFDDQSQPLVSHHVHRENEPLPGSKGSAPTFDYSPDAIESANIPPSELGTTPDTQSRFDHHHTQSPATFTSQENRDAPIVPSARIAPYEATVLENALNSTSKNDEFERNPLKTPDHQHQVRQNPVDTQRFSPPTVDQSANKPSNLERHHEKADQQAKSAGPFVPSHVGKTEGDRTHSVYDIDGQPKSASHGQTNTAGDNTKPSIGDKIIGTTEKVRFKA